VFILVINGRAEARYLLSTDSVVRPHFGDVIQNFQVIRLEHKLLRACQWSLITPLPIPEPISEILALPSDIKENSDLRTKHTYMTIRTDKTRASGDLRSLAHSQRGRLLAQTSQPISGAIIDPSDAAFAREQRIAFWHQVLGLASLALLTATVVTGTINSADTFAGRTSSPQMLWSHRILMIGTSAVYLSSASLAIVMASQRGKNRDSSGGESGSTKLHRILAWVHGFGMLGLIAGGLINANAFAPGTTAKTAFTASHLAAGYVTLAALTGAFIVISFF
jgi:hypothetical protein